MINCFFMAILFIHCCMICSVFLFQLLKYSIGTRSFNSVTISYLNKLSFLGIFFKVNSSFIIFSLFNVKISTFCFSLSKIGSNLQNRIQIWQCIFCLSQSKINCSSSIKRLIISKKKIFEF